MTTIKRGLNLPILGSPEQHIENAPPVTRVGLLGDDYIGMKPTMLVQPGDRVRLGQPILEDKKNPGVLYTAPAAGTVAEVNRGAKRKFESVVIDVDGDDRVEFDGATGQDPLSMGPGRLTELLVQSGLWTSLRTRPFGKVPAIGSTPHSIFVTAIDTNPLAGDPSIVIADRKDQFTLGLTARNDADRWQVVPLQVIGGGDPWRRPAEGSRRVVFGSTPGRFGRHTHSHARSGRADQDGLVHRLSRRLRDRFFLADRHA